MTMLFCSPVIVEMDVNFHCVNSSGDLGPVNTAVIRAVLEKGKLTRPVFAELHYPSGEDPDNIQRRVLSYLGLTQDGDMKNERDQS